MKTLNKTLSAAVVTCLLVVFVTGTALAQGNQPASELLRIRKLTPLNNRDHRQNVPTLGSGRTARPRDWGVFDVTFDMAPEWVDDMTITYTLMLQRDKPKQDEKPLSLMTLTATYNDVAQGRDRKAGVVIPPPALERFGAPIGFSVQFFIAGQLVAEQGSVSGLLSTQKDKPWWKIPEVIDSPMVQKRDGYMVERSKSAFSLVDIDAYEAGK